MTNDSQPASCDSRPESRDQQPFRVGDLIFTRIDNFLYRRVSAVTDCWFNHVGVVVDDTPGAERVAESTVPFVKVTPLRRFVAKSAQSRYAVRRLPRELSDHERAAVQASAQCRLGRLYHLGFKLDSQCQFCSKFAHEVYREALNLEIGQVETFRELLATKPDAPMTFWKIWFFGFIPWKRLTVSPASEYRDPQFVTVSETPPPGQS